jgi:hypothetical protein
MCPGCNGPIREEESYVYGSSCVHRFHVGHHVQGTACQQCIRVKEQARVVEYSVYQASTNGAYRVRQQAEEYERLRQLKEQEECRKNKEQRNFETKAYTEKARKAQQAWETKRGEEEAQRVAQEESRNARGVYVSPAQAKVDQQDVHGHLTAVEMAKEQNRAFQQRQAFERQQAFIRSNEGMMKTCTLCLCPLAQRDTALPCGDVYHTACIKKAAQHDNRCPNCRALFKIEDLLRK